jgi:uncharacterized protein YndB with AHSA1/START domain
MPRAGRDRGRTAARRPTFPISTSAPAGNEFVISRIFHAPREVVFEVWTRCEHLMRWWGPQGFTMLACTIDPRPGGVFHYGMRAPDGSEMWGKWVFREIDAPKRLTSIVAFSDEMGGLNRHPLAPGWPLEMMSTLEFDRVGDRTRVTIRSSPYAATKGERRTFEAGHESMRQGWGGTLDRVDAYLRAAAERSDGS